MTRSSIITIGASSGGVVALRSIAAALPAAFSAPLLVVLHIGALRSELPALLNMAGPLPAKHAEDGDMILPGHIYVAPPDRHMIVADGRLRLVRGPKENSARPAIDPLFRSVAENFGSDAVGVILTGNLNDGTLGLFEIKRRGGVAIGQNPNDAAYPDMPRSAAEHVALDYCPPLADIPELLIELVDQKKGRKAVMSKTSPQLNGQQPEIVNNQTFERPITVTCPDCGGALKRFEVGSIVKFGCHIGHTYTAEILATAQFEEMEKTMRAAVRFLNERGEFCLQMAEHGGTVSAASADDWHAASKQALDRAYKLRDLVEQEWLTPETSGRRAAASEGGDQTPPLE
ncbi:chemotaxis protein CheB [Hoeflea sp.]|uniref:chemotaxis protein CheB n=1 Tax=Hoeflea sp. TaxID=1940281 RepID=UPI0019CBE3A3|nr:chemotaxis protein CheB [Hoeflea sp.]MBC7283276.1 chemotaxis protein CheB [Hoeflea sp.]